MEAFSLRGRPAYEGVAEGEALVCPESIQGWAGVDDLTGIIIERGHSQRGQSIQGRILVLPGSKGSNGWSGHFHSAAVAGHSPAGWVFTRIDPRSGVAIAVLGIPAVCDIQEADPCAVIHTGDWVKVDGSTGRVEVTPRRQGDGT
jgi:predicted aconitase with swiveling domain